MSGKRFFVEVQPRIPVELKRLNEFSNNLIYSWERQIRSLFPRLDSRLWEDCGHNPTIFLRRIDQRLLENAVSDTTFMQEYARACSSYDSYLGGELQKEVVDCFHSDDLVSYSCAEFGLHESLPIYSGGLGILAGDHCKAASDLGIPFVAMGILYHLGYFIQRIDGEGNQIAEYTANNFSDLPVKPVFDADGQRIMVIVTIAGRQIFLQLWLAKVGHISLYLLDSDIEQNTATDRAITHQLYGGDNNNRLLQEVVLGIGGVRAHRALGLKPTVWHINEGHAAFQIIERCRELVAVGESFTTALEAVAANTVFTSHTPVPAGHDVFDHEQISHNLGDMVCDLGISMAEFFELGRSPTSENGFNMTALALRGSRFHNGVSRIHGGVASEQSAYVWPDIPADENPVDYVTNGIHLPTFISNEWNTTFDLQFGGGWRNNLLTPDYWRVIDTIPDHNFWSVRRLMKARMLELINRGYTEQLRRNGVNDSQIQRLTRFINPHNTDVLTVGFARRFATYKRAWLLFSDLERLKKLLDDSTRPVVFIFAGKAHPHDEPGQDMIRRIHEISLMPDFEGKVILIENYDMSLARKLVTGVDVWLNTPAFPLEASGTSGQKAGINGVLNLSVLDGWWDEGYNGDNGWKISAHDASFEEDFRNAEESRELLLCLEQEVVPLYYHREGSGYSEGWIEKSKNAMKSLIPQYNSQRMVVDYIRRFYVPASAQGGRLSKGVNLEKARELTQWKTKIREHWHGIHIELAQQPQASLFRDEQFHLLVNVALDGLEPEDVIVECLLGEGSEDSFAPHSVLALEFQSFNSAGQAEYSLSISLDSSGSQSYMLRIFPYHSLLAHRFEMGFLKWV
ncbi:alpha-glucan phosphorylase [Gammaproteobacteria bacterium 50_400_T64]|nr:alpha-glucan phosphorylase [Gammaproteobacteria bacterium 50_400_T64]